MSYFTGFDYTYTYKCKECKREFKQDSNNPELSDARDCIFCNSPAILKQRYDNNGDPSTEPEGEVDG